LKLGTFTLDIFSPKAPKPQEAPFEKQPTPGVPDQAWLAAIEKSRKEAAELDKQFNLAVIEGIDRARLAEQYRFDDEQKQIKSLTIDEMQKNALLEKAYAAHQVAMTKIEKQGVDSRRALNIQPKANRDLTDFLSNFRADDGWRNLGITPLPFSGSGNNGSQTGEWIGGARSSDSNENGRVIELSIDGYKIGRVLWELSRSGRLAISESAIVTKA